MIEELGRAIQLFCDRKGCEHCFPPEGPVDRTVITIADLRGMARGFGWTRRRRNPGFFGSIDVCPECDETPCCGSLQ